MSFGIALKRGLTKVIQSYTMMAVEVISSKGNRAMTSHIIYRPCNKCKQPVRCVVSDRTEVRLLRVFGARHSTCKG